MRRSHDRISNGYLIPKKKTSHMCNGMFEEGLETAAPNLLGSDHGSEE